MDYMFSSNIYISLFSPDEIMQLDNSPLRAADITPDLKKKFAILSGDTPTSFSVNASV